MRRQVEDRVGPSFSLYVHRVASPYVKPESNDPPLRRRAWGEQHWSAQNRRRFSLHSDVLGIGHRHCQDM